MAVGHLRRRPRFLPGGDPPDPRGPASGPARTRLGLHWLGFHGLPGPVWAFTGLAFRACPGPFGPSLAWLSRPARARLGPSLAWLHGLPGPFGPSLAWLLGITATQGGRPPRLHGPIFGLHRVGSWGPVAGSCPTGPVGRVPGGGSGSVWRREGRVLRNPDSWNLGGWCSGRRGSGPRGRCAMDPLGLLSRVWCGSRLVGSRPWWRAHGIFPGSSGPCVTAALLQSA